MLKRFYIYLLLGIGIVLTIPNTVFAEASCNFNEAGGNPITSDYAKLEERHLCNADDVMEINSGATMAVDPVVIKVGGSDGISITNSGTISGGLKTINLGTGDNTILTNKGIIESDNQKVINVSAGGDNVTITNSGTIKGTSADNSGVGIYLAGDNAVLTNSKYIFTLKSKAVTVVGDNATITNQSGGEIRAGSEIGSDGSVDANHVNAVLFNNTDSNYKGTLENYGKLTAAQSTVKVGMQNVVINNYSGGIIQFNFPSECWGAIYINFCTFYTVSNFY